MLFSTCAKCQNTFPAGSRTLKIEIELIYLFSKNKYFLGITEFDSKQYHVNI